MTKFLSSSAGFRGFLDVLRNRGLLNYSIEYVNRRRHMIVRSLDMVFYVLYKDSFFMSFNKQFSGFVKDFPEYKGLGESINKRWLEKAIQLESKLVFVYPSGKMYFFYPKAFKRFSTVYGLKRTQDRGETTYSIPVKILKRFDEQKVNG